MFHQNFFIFSYIYLFINSFFFLWEYKNTPILQLFLTSEHKYIFGSFFLLHVTGSIIAFIQKKLLVYFYYNTTMVNFRRG